MKNTLFPIFTLLFFIINTNIYAQSQDEIEQMYDNQEGKKNKKASKNQVSSNIIDTLVNEGSSSESPINLLEEEAIVTSENVRMLNLDESLNSWKLKALQKEGDALAEKGSYYKALDYYNMAIAKTAKKKKLSYLNYQAGNAAFHSRDYSLAVSYFDYLMNNDKKGKFALASYQLANSLKYLAKYEEAASLYQGFQQKEEGNKKLALELNRARLEQKGCKYGLDLLVEEPAYVLKNPGEEVNGPYSDAGPELKGKDLVFSKIEGNGSDDSKDDHFSRLFIAENYKDNYGLAQTFSSNLNLTGRYVGNPSFSADQKTLYFSVCESTSDHLAKNCQIYTSSLIAGIWEEPYALGNNINEANTSSSYPQIVIDETGQELLYFVAEREKGRGGKDIWYALKNEDGSFEKARNMGYPINTKYDELSPFYHKTTQTLYYSSNGEISLGGFDVYASTKLEDGEWSEPANLETPVNSSLDDYDFILNNRGDLGYLVSNRVGTTTLRNETCCDDIFEVRSTKIEPYLELLVYAENKGERSLIDQANLLLQNLALKNVDTYEFSGTKKIIPLEKEVDYSLVAVNDNYEDLLLNFSTKGMLRSDTLHYDLFFDANRFTDGKIIGTIYYDFNNANLTSEAPKTLSAVVEFLKKYPELKVEVAAHTDGKGTEEYNLKLSEERSYAAANYLIFEGVDKDRIINAWFGEAKPIAPNENEDSSDNPDGRALNRRTEFRIKF